MSSNDRESDTPTSEGTDASATEDAAASEDAASSASEDTETSRLQSGGEAVASAYENADATASPSVPEGFGEPPADDEGSRWGTYALAGLLAVVFLIGLVRISYPNLSILVIGTLLALFGLLVGVVAVWNRIRGS
ncbi:hypothetical protein [Halorussus litoreus]|uniref:hypothetical protein n=1 Tax=Halorussus litoreus TaxID=1710536 RepID=UPI000E256B59|nr:hypothetical protein [Halorussus litoreus]